MEKLVLTGTVCFCVGLTIGLILGCVVMALAVAAKKYKPKTEEIDDCWGCFGAAMGDCDHCPVNGGDDVPKQGSLPLNFAEHIMNRFMERI